ncbi:hypothetical protein BJP36_35535 [Moorena producens JHB]|uniref:Uncharacterized protein n=1 Tax=Moorena producens (strain JHB) TaxID=1454205 RepID=A0A9Q9STJ8_MOOP1|nr:hypothetical protein BJP36_35535 [Moorena producens JHB]
MSQLLLISQQIYSVLKSDVKLELMGKGNREQGTGNRERKFCGTGILPVSFPRQQPNTGDRENEGSPKGCALRGGLSQRWLRGEK